MKILHFVNSIDVATGGPARSITSLIEVMAVQTSNIFHLSTSLTSNPIITQFKYPNVSLSFFENKKGLYQQLIKILQFSPEVVHIHGLWHIEVFLISRFAQLKGVPYIITPRGMLEPWSLSQKKFKKQLARFFYQDKVISRAAIIHATSMLEMRNIRALGFKNPITVVPNGINLENYNVSRIQVPKEKKTLLFLSRIHEKKGIEVLISAWKQLNPIHKRDWQVRIVGDGDSEYIKSLISLVSTVNLSNEIHFTGPKYGADKIAEYQNADLFILPTYSENFGMVIAEALASGLPVITTTGTPWEEIAIFKCGWWIDIGVESLISTLNVAFELNSFELNEMGERGRKLVQNNYSIDGAAKKMLELYDWIDNKGQKPNFVFNI